MPRTPRRENRLVQAAPYGSGADTGPLHIRLLGGFGIATDAAEALSLPGKRQRTLVAYLLLHRDIPSDRKHLAFLLWPESSEQQALTNLRQLIHELRAVLQDPERFLDAGRQLVRWRTDAPCAVDVDEFRAALALAADANGNETETIAALSKAVALCDGDLLPECYDDWIEPFRRRLRDDLATTLRRLVRLLEDRREYRTAIPYATRLLELAPLDESLTLALMRLHAADGERGAALDAYAQCAERLRHELGIAPGAVLREFRERLMRALPMDDERAPPAEPPPFKLVGRAHEWRRLMQIWTAVRREAPRCIVVSGVAGIGKTRLVEELVRCMAAQGASVATSRCYGTVGNLPYASIADWLRSPSLRAAVAGLAEAKRAELTSILPECDRGAGSAGGGKPHPEARRRLFEAVAHAVAAASQPVLLFLDDLQWADRETFEWIGWFLRSTTPARVVVVATLRAGEMALETRLDAVVSELAREGRLEEIALEPLCESEAAALGAAVSGVALDEEASRELHAETEGHPLYIVERMRAQEAQLPGGASSDHSTVQAGTSGGKRVQRPLPQRVRAIIEYRLAQLSPTARSVVGVASVVGREFALDLLAETAQLRAEDAETALEELLARRLVRDRGDGVYDFTHDRIREVAYAALGPARRRRLHRRIAEAQIVSAAGVGRSVAAIAKHLEQAGLVEGAIPYYRLAAEHAMAIYASGEAMRHLETALALLKQLPASRARLIQEIDLRTAYCIALVHLQHYGARVLAEYRRVRGLCDRVGSEPAPPALRALALACIMQANMTEAVDIGRRLRAAAPASEDPMLFVEAEYVLGVTAFWLGRPVAATRHLLAALHAYHPSQALAHVSIYGQDAGAVCGVRLAQTLWMIGKSAAAARMVRKAIAHAETVAHPHTLAYVRQFAAWTLIDFGDEAGARRQIDGAMALTAAHGLSGWVMRNEALHGYLLAREGHVDEGIRTMQQAAREWSRWSWRMAVPWDRAQRAQVCLDAGRLTEGLEAIEEGMADARETGQTFWDAELLRLRAELLLAGGAPTAAVERLLREARAIAAGQGATALVRRAESNLRRLAAPT